MKTLDNTNLGYLLTKIKNAFIRNTDVIEVTEVPIDSTPTANSNNLVTSGGVYSAIPTALSQLSDDSTHRLVTDTEKSTWNDKGTTFRVW